MAIKGKFLSGFLSVFGDGADNTITVSRDAAGNILVNGGAVAVTGGTPTVANTALIRSSARAATTPSPSTRPTAPCQGASCSAVPATTP